tara:strand:- start:80305 stop:81117 length:813 start_codon:yes stop_codon:yes gene_type:complete
MPELPEVETSTRGIRPHMRGQTVTDVIVRQRQLRWPIPSNLKRHLVQQTIRDVTRRGKYILLTTDNGTAILHLGMSGSLRILPATTAPLKHDHVDIVLQSGKCLRFNDPRRFGCLLWSKQPGQHKLLSQLGPEPLSDEFTTDYLFQQSRKKKQAVKTFIMDSHVVVGVGNIYANEALFMAGIRPRVAAGGLSKPRYEKLVTAIKFVLQRSIDVGGTTLKDFLDSDGKPGYFQQMLNVYGRGDLPCRKCDTKLKEIRLGQRSTVYCPQCQR